MLTFPGGLSKQDIFETDVFIQVGPVDTFSLPDKAPVISLLQGAVEEPWIPGKSRGNGATIIEINDQAVQASGSTSVVRGPDYRRETIIVMIANTYTCSLLGIDAILVKWKWKWKWKCRRGCLFLQ